MSRSRANSTAHGLPPQLAGTVPATLAAPTGLQKRRNSQSQIEGAIAAIQAKNENASRQTGGYMGGPPGDAVDANGMPLGRKASKKSRRDPTTYLLNGKRVKTTERICDEVPPVERRLPTEAQFWTKTDRTQPKPSLSFLRSHLLKEGRLTEEQALYILNATTNIFKEEPNLLIVGDGVTICGDVHGQFYDLMKLFDVGGDPAETPYLFLGDYVDRGMFGIECLLYLYAHKIHYPNTFFMLRGNHECRHLTEYFTFKKECLHKYGPQVYEACIRSFNALPLAALLDGRFLCVHGGIGPDLETLDDINKIHRFQEPDMDGPLCDILWADPKEDYSRVQGADEPPSPRVRRYTTRKGKGREGEEGDLLPVGFTHNKTRGCSFYYDYTAVTRFLNRNNILSVIRAHEAQDTGYRMYRATPLNFPSLITIFSAPDYLDAYGNRAAVIKYIKRDITIRQFNSVPHPYVLPGHMNAFTWSLPFVGAKIAEMLLAILNCCTAEELEEASSSEDEGVGAGAGASGRVDVRRLKDDHSIKRERREEIKNKILAMGKMAKVFELLREDAEGVTELDYRAAPTQDTKLNIQNQRISRSITSFDDARKYDIINEHLPMTRPSSPSPSASGTYPSQSQRARSAGPPTRGASSEDTYYGDTPSPSFRRHTTEEKIRRTLAEEDQDIVRLANRLARPLTGSKEVRRAYGVKEGNSEARRKAMRRMDTT